MKYTFSFKEINYGSIEIESDHEPDNGEVIDAIMGGGAYYGDTGYENIALDGDNALDMGANNKGEKETVHGYVILRSIAFENNQGFALAGDPDAPDPLVTWQFTENEIGKRDYYWGHYASSKESATRDYENRIAVFIHENAVSEKNAYKYYSTQRPVDIATYPTTDNGPVRFENFDKRETVESGDFRAWGYLIYDAPLSEKQINDYELRAAPGNPDERQAEQKLFKDYCLQDIPVSPEVKRDMITQAQLVGHWEESKAMPDNKRFTWGKPSIHAFALRVPVVSPEQLEQRYYQAINEFNHESISQSHKKPIAEQLAEAAKLVERDKVNKTDKKQNREER